MADLIDLTYYQTITGDNSATKAPRYAAAITAASQAVRTYTDRSFDVNASGVATPRPYQYDGSGFLDIDDCTTVTSVVTDAGVPNGNPITLDPTYDYKVEPVGGSVLYYIEVFNTYQGYSPEMGFKSNLDNPLYPRNMRPVIFTVTATWGWPTVPDDVKMAVVWTAAAMASDPSPYIMESINGYSRATSNRTPMVALPDRAKDLLAGYLRLEV